MKLGWLSSWRPFNANTFAPVLPACVLIAVFGIPMRGQDIVLSNATVSSGTLTYQPSGAITAGPSYVINGPATVTFAAGTQVNLEPGFHVVASSGSLFDARSGVQLSGQILVNGSGMAGVAVTLTGTAANGATVGQTVITGPSGTYVFNVPIGGTYTLVPALSGYSFSPASQTFSNVSTATPAQTTNASPGGSSSPPPTISGLSLPTGPPLMGFVINGHNFGASQGASNVVFNGTSLTVVSWSASAITVQIPAGTATGSGAIKVTVGGQAATTGFSVSASFGCSG